MTNELASARTYVQHHQAKLAVSVFAALVGAVLDAMGPDAPGDLCFAGGQRWFAGMGIQIPDDAEFVQISQLINAALMPQDWGFCEFQQSQRALLVRHHLAPLVEVFGSNRLYHGAEWLRGFYDGLFAELMPEASLMLELDEDQSDELVLCFRVLAA